MQTLNDQSNYRSRNAETPADTQNVSLITIEITPAEAELINLVNFFDPLALSVNLKHIHDLALYHTDLDIDQKDKNALYAVNALAEILMKIAKETV